MSYVEFLCNASSSSCCFSDFFRPDFSEFVLFFPLKYHLCVFRLKGMDITMAGEKVNQGEIVIYQSENGDTKIDVRFVDETV